MKKRCAIVAITGRSGSGKSSAGRFFKAAGCEVIDGDAVARQVQRPGSPCLSQLTKTFGSGILLQNGELNRRYLGEICFSDKGALKKLNSIVHPYVVEAILDRSRELAERGVRFCFVEAPALVESGLIDYCDRVILIESERERTLERLMARDELSRQSASRRLDSQLSSEDFRSIADSVIVNDGTLPQLEEKLRRELDFVTEWSRKINSERGVKMKLKDPKAAAQSLLSSKKSGFEIFEGREEEIRAYSDRYISYLGEVKTEREAVDYAVKELESAGFRPFDPSARYSAGDRVYINNRGKSLIAARIGTLPLEQGVRMVASHIDSPRLDLKPNPLYEQAGFAYLKSHYYGGIKKYQWASIPLCMRGVVVLKDGSVVKVNIGDKDTDPVFVVNDLLPHLAGKLQGDRKSGEVLKGEDLNILVGNEPVEGEEIKEPVKLAVLSYLHESFGMTEEDFVSAEIEFVPNFKPRYVGFDKSMVGAYGQDDRICAYTSTTAFIATEEPAHTALLILADKEETGSNGNTGLNSDFLRSFISLLSLQSGCAPEIVLQNSKCLSSDVSAAYDPNFAEVYELHNASRLNFGPSLEKYTGSRGKSGTSEASAEYVAWVRELFDSNGIPWQADELGKIDEGGGGTVAMFIAKLGVDVVDLGAPVLAMHSPYEVTGTRDLFALHEAYSVFYR